MSTPTMVKIPYVANVVHSYLCGNPDHIHHSPGVLAPIWDDTWRVATNVPANRPEHLVVITSASTTDAAGNLVLSPRRVIVQVSHDDETTAGDLSETVFAYMKIARYTQFEMNGDTKTWIRDVIPVGTPARFDDPDDSTPRFQMTLDILLRAKIA